MLEAHEEKVEKSRRYNANLGEYFEGLLPTVTYYAFKETLVISLPLQTPTVL